MSKMSQTELETFLRNRKAGCYLGCLDDDGAPYVVPCWFHYGDDGYYIVPRARSLWAQYLKADERVSLCIEEAGSGDRIIVQGRAKLLESPNVGGRWVEIARKMVLRYLGEEGMVYLEKTMHEPRWLFFVIPEQTKSWQGGGWASQYKHTQW